MAQVKHLFSILLCWTVIGSPIRVIDGDTFTVDVLIWIKLRAQETVRIKDINTPEPRGDTKAAAALSTKFTTDWLARGDITLFTCGKDVFGRILAIVTRGESDLGKELLDAGLAKEDKR